MTASIVPYVYDFVVRCDKKVCSAEARKSIRAMTQKEREQAEHRACAALAAEGWTHWVGTHPATPCTDKRVHRLIQDARVNALTTLDHE